MALNSVGVCIVCDQNCACRRFGSSLLDRDVWLEYQCWTGFRVLAFAIQVRRTIGKVNRVMLSRILSYGFEEVYQTFSSFVGPCIKKSVDVISVILCRLHAWLTRHSLLEMSVALVNHRVLPTIFFSLSDVISEIAISFILQIERDG